jgi:hypothetical protein
MRTKKPTTLTPIAAPKDGPSNENEIGAFLHCALCIEEFKAGKARGESPRSYARLEAGWTRRGLQVWCVRHEANVLHVDFEGQQHRANTTRKA